ncbi:MAG TPA: hypothetical protein VGX51_11815 [Solirubrobacteraceae bacterium]|jgi:FtsH-binding integral membrane protein|nr:hypothetical protein [Solirubrobacteraceae bacterium]
MSRFISWLATGVAAAFLIVAAASFSVGAVVWLAFGISVGTLVVSAGIAYYNRADVPSVSTALAIVVISAWTIVASLVFSPTTVQGLALASSLAISVLTLVGLTANELSGAAHSVKDHSSERKSRLAAAA